MGLADVDRILEGIKLASQGFAARQQAQLEQQRQEAESEYRKKDLEARIQQHKDQTAYQQATLKAAQALHQAQRMADIHKMSGDYPASGIVPPSASVSPGQTPGTSTLTFDPSMYGTQDIQIPGIIGGMPSPITQQVPTPEAYTKLMGQQAEAKEAPRRETAGERLASQEEIARSRQENQAAIQKLRDEMAADRQQTLRNSVEFIARSTNEMRERIADLKAKGQGGDVDLEFPLQQLRDGNWSVQDIKRNYVNRADQDAVLKAAHASRLTGLDDKQKLIRAGFATAAEAIPRMHEFISELQTNNLSNFAPNSRARQLQAQVGETLAAATSALNRAGARLSDKRVQIMERAFLPHLNIFPGNLQWNVNNVRDFEELLKKAYKENFPNLSGPELDHQMAGAFGTSANSSDIVKVKSPKGLIKPIHRSELQWYLDHGAEEVK